MDTLYAREQIDVVAAVTPMIEYLARGMESRICIAERDTIPLVVRPARPALELPLPWAYQSLRMNYTVTKGYSASVFVDWLNDNKAIDVASTAAKLAHIYRCGHYSPADLLRHTEDMRQWADAYSALDDDDFAACDRTERAAHAACRDDLRAVAALAASTTRKDA